MRYETLDFDISEEVSALGLRGAYLAMGGLANKQSNLDFERLKQESLASILARLSAEAIAGDPILQGFRTLHEAAGVSNSRKNLAAPESLLKFLLKTGTLPKVNILVDIYNLVSAETRLALGAHDIAQIEGNVHLRLTDGSERFWPLGAPEAKFSPRGEYAYVDDANDILCRLEVRQVEKTKVALGTTEVFYIVQGNAAAQVNHIQAAVRRLVTLTKRFSGGSDRFLRLQE